MSWISVGVAAVGVGTSIYKGVKASSAEDKAREELSNLKPSFYKIQDEYNQNRNLSASMAGQGLPTATRDYQTAENQKGFGSGVSAIEQAGGSPSDIAKLYSGFTNSVNQTGAEDANLQFKNMQYFMKANQDLAGQKTIQWDVNEYNPYQNKLKEITQRIGASQINQNNALNEGVSSIGSLGTSLANRDLLDKLLEAQKKDPYSLPIRLEGQYGAINPGSLRNNNGETIQPINLPSNNTAPSGDDFDVFHLINSTSR